MSGRLSKAASFIASYPGPFYIIVLAVVGLAQTANFMAFAYGGAWVQTVLPTYTHVLSLTIGTIFLFRAVQLVFALLWASFVGCPPPPPPYSRDRLDLPIVTVQIPVRNEPLSVARTAIDAALALDYPCDRLEIQVLDNSDSTEFSEPIEDYLNRRAREAKAAGDCPEVTFLHRDGTRGFKAGNLNLGLSVARGSVFLVLDADSSVPSDALLTALPYFEDPNLGLVQLRIDPTNEDENIITRAAAITIRARYMTMRVRDTQGIVQFDGHNGLIRREALEAVGGWAEEVSEDLATSVRMILAGYTARYAELPSGELLPTGFQELYKQRRRWSLGTVNFLKQDGLAILKSKQLRWFQKLDLFYASLNILVEALAWIVIFTFAALPVTTFLEIVFVFSVLPTLLSSGLGLAGTLKRQLSVIFVISAILPALVEGAAKGLLGGSSQFAVTRKNDAKRLSLGELVWGHRFSICAAALFFTVAIILAPGVGNYVNSYLPGTVIMSASVLAPLILNYWRGEKSG